VICRTNEFSGLAAHMALGEMVLKKYFDAGESDGSAEQELFLNAAAGKQSHRLFRGQPGLRCN
jgi:hypothetical protein